MKKQRITAVLLCLALLISLCACGQPPVTEPEPTQPATPAPVEPTPPAQEPEPVPTEEPVPTPESSPDPEPTEPPGGRQLIACDEEYDVQLFAEEDGTLFMERRGLSGQVFCDPTFTNYYEPPSRWGDGPFDFAVSGGYDDSGMFYIDISVSAQKTSERLLSARVYWDSAQKLWNRNSPGSEVPKEPDEPVLPPEPIDPAQEPPLDEYAKNVAVPKFLTREQQALYRRANAMYRILTAAFTTWIDEFDESRDYELTYEVVEINGYNYILSSGRYADWAEFEAVIHSLFTDEMWQALNTNEYCSRFINYNGRMAYLDAGRGAGYFYNGEHFPDRFELVSMTEDEIVFTLIGHYTEVYSTAGMSREEAREYMRTVCEYTQEFTIRMVRTEDGWRFDEFHSAATEEIGPTEPGAIPYEPEEEQEFLLPVYTNTMAGGYEDLYAITEDGRLLMWGTPEFTEGLYGGELGGEPIVLMENAAAIYCGTRGNVVVVDRDGTLWALDNVGRYSTLNPNVTNRTSPYEPVWIMDDVAMVEIDWLQTLIVQRDGTLLSVDLGGEVSTIMGQVEDAWPYGYGGYARTVDGTLWHWGSGPEAFDPIVAEEEPDWLKLRDCDRWVDVDGLTAWNVTIPNVVQPSSYWALQEDGTLWNWGDKQYDEIPTPPAPVLDGVKQFTLSEHGILVLKQDGSYWYSYAGNFGSYHSPYKPLEFVCVYDPNLHLPVYPHTMDAGVDNDLYAVLDDGRLVMWGGEHYLQGGTFEDGPVVLMENIAAVYATGAGSGLNPSIVAIDKEGTLWGLYGSLCKLNPDYDKATSEMPIRLMDNVAMIAGTTFWDYILLRDGTLLHWGGPEGFPGFHDHTWADPDNPGKPGGLSLTKIMDNVIYVACGGDGGWAITADHVLWEWDSSHEIKQSAENAAWVFGFYDGDYLTTDGIYVDRRFSLTGSELEPVLQENVVQVEYRFIVLEDGSLLQRISYDDVLATGRIMGDVAQVAAFDSGYGVLIRKTDGSYWYAKVTASSPDKLRPVAPRKIYPIEEGLPPAEDDPKDAFSAVLNGTLGYYDVDAGKTMYLHTDSYSVYFREDKHSFIADMAAADLDNDGIREVVLRLNTVIAPSASVTGYKVLHYRDGVIYGYAFDTTAFNQLKEDGTCSYSNSGDDYGWYTLSFSDQGYKLYPFTYRVPGTEVEGLYYVKKEPASKEAFLEAIQQLYKKHNAQWFECDSGGLSAITRLIN